jgi:hypothetical protein
MKVVCFLLLSKFELLNAETYCKINLFNHLVIAVMIL